MDRIVHTKIHVGLEAPVKILHITDVHLSEFTELDPPECEKFLVSRKVHREEALQTEGHYPSKTANEFFEEAIEIAEKNGYLLVNTGDSVDMNYPGNYAEFHRITKGHDMMFSPGGHEFQRRFCRTVEEPYPYVETVVPQVRKILSEYDLTLESRIINGLNVVTIDDSLEYFTKDAHDRLVAEIAKGYPILLFMHVALTNSYLNRVKPPKPIVRITEEEWNISDETVKLICECPLIVATFAGHSHEESIQEKNGKAVYVTPQLIAGACRLIEVD